MHKLKQVRWVILWVAVTLVAGCTVQAQNPNAQARALFETFFEEQVELSPMFQTYLGRKTDYGQWDDISPAQDERYQALRKNQLHRLQQLDPEQLNPSTRLSYELMEYQLQQEIEAYRWRDHDYPVNQMFGLHAQIPSFLINNHRVDNVSDARAYISRLKGVAPLMEQLIANLERRANKGILAPRFVYPQVIEDSRNLISGAPFVVERDSEDERASEAVDDKPAPDSPLLADFRSKVEALDLEEAQQKQLMSNAVQALKGSVQPAYEALIDALETLEKQADDRAGVWKLPEGHDYYANQLERRTTTDLSAEEIHRLGLNEVARIHKAMRELIRDIGHEGDLQSFFAAIRNDPDQYYPNTESGREAYLMRTRDLVQAMEARLDEVFNRLPEAELKVKAVEPFREESAGKAFYQGPAADSSRPGIFYVNLHEMKALPKYQMAALTFHETLPGHHMQVALAQEMQDLPSFRQHSSYTAYNEGWGVYAEYLPKEMGFYADPYSDFGRLGMELWRAVRLVVDTGLHAKRWTREEAIDYVVEQTPMTRDDAVREVERYIVMPGQATAYKVGMNKILELRAQAKAELGDAFDIRDFHDQVLDGGALPLTVLEEQVSKWIEAERRSASSSEP